MTILHVAVYLESLWPVLRILPMAEIGQQILQSPIAETLAGLRTRLEDRLLAVNQGVVDCVNAHPLTL
jgi:hypothetical protein